VELVFVYFNIFVTGYWYRMEKNRMKRNTMEKKEAKRRVS